MDVVDLIAKTRSGVAQVLIERKGEIIGAGSGFLTKAGLATCSHCIRDGDYDAALIKFERISPDDSEKFIRLIPKDNIVIESPQVDKDYVILKLENEEVHGRHVFEFIEAETKLSVGEQALFIGYPFGMKNLTAHLGYISSIHEKEGIEIIQIDGSVNGGNSGGPLLELRTGTVAGIVTRAITGLIEKQFLSLIDTLKRNKEILLASKVIMKIGGIDLIQALAASQAAMEQIAKDLHRSANVGIGYAYSSKYMSDNFIRINSERN
jgi:S1-C subfamily serine protease